MSGETVLVVEDNPSNMKLVKAILLSDGYDVHLAEDAEIAQIKLATIHPQLILMDIQLPGMDGLTLTRLLKADPHTRDILIVMHISPSLLIGFPSWVASDSILTQSHLQLKSPTRRLDLKQTLLIQQYEHVGCEISAYRRC